MPAFANMCVVPHPLGENPGDATDNVCRVSNLSVLRTLMHKPHVL